MGTVVPSREITINPQVTGLIVSVDPVVIPGGLIQKDQVLYQIDSRDYKTAVRQQESQVAKANLDIKLESGYQEVAQQEYQMLEEVVSDQDKELVLRKPQMIQQQAALDASDVDRHFSRRCRVCFLLAFAGHGGLSCAGYHRRGCGDTRYRALQGSARAAKRRCWRHAHSRCTARPRPRFGLQVFSCLHLWLVRIGHVCGGVLAGLRAGSP